MQPPGRVHRGAVADREHVCRPVREADAGAGRGDLHDRLRVVGSRVREALLRRRDTERCAVVVRAVVQPCAPTCRGVDHAGDRCRAIHAENRLRRLDLELEPQATGGQVVAVFERVADRDHGAYLLDAVDLWQRHDEAGEQAAHGEVSDHQVERAQAALSGRPLQALEPDAVRDRGPDPAHDTGQRCRRGDRVRVLDVVGPVAVPVLEVHAQVLDRFTLELRDHAGIDIGREFGREPDRRGQRSSVGSVLGERGQRRRSPLPNGFRRDAGGRYVHRVHRLASACIAGVVPPQRLVPGIEQGVDAGEHAVGEREPRHVLTP